MGQEAGMKWTWLNFKTNTGKREEKNSEWTLMEKWARGFSCIGMIRKGEGHQWVAGEGEWKDGL